MNTYQKTISLMAAMSTVGASSFIGESPVSSFLRMSDDMNDWTAEGEAGSWGICVIGFTVFIMTYLFVVVALFHDVLGKIKEYSGLIEDDKDQLTRLGFNIEDADFLQALENRLKGVKEDEGADDQLIGEAMKLTSAEYSA